MITGAQPKFEASIKDGKLILEEPIHNWKLVRERDGLTKQSKGIKWVEWNEDGRFKEQFEEIGLNRSLIMSPFNDFFTWQTTRVTEVLADREDYKEFKTENSHYRLFKL